MDQDTSDFGNLGDYASPDVVEALRQFSDLANRWTLHPLDSKRWYRFIILSHYAHKKLSASDLCRWLEEVAKWPEDRAEQLRDEYEDGLELLAAYDQFRHGVAQ